MSHLYNPFKPEVDAFNRQRVSTPYTLGDYKHIYNIDPDFLNISSGVGATISFDYTRAAAILNSGISTNGYIIHQTKRYHHYQPGKSQLIFSTFNFGQAQSNVIKRTGYFDDRDGIFFEQSQTGTLNFVIRSSVNGILSERRVSQSNWNIDTLDGRGPSEFNLNISKTQLFLTDFEWLGVGRVRCGFSIQGKNVLAHEFYNSNELENVYMSNPNLPIRCEMRNVGTQIGIGGSMIQICGTVMSEGGYSEVGYEWEYLTPLRQIGISSSNVPLLALRLKNTYKNQLNRSTVKIRSVEVFTDRENISYEVIKIPGIVGINTGSSSWISVNDNSGCEINVSATSISGFYESFIGGYSAASSGSGQSGKNLATATNQSPGPSAKKNFIAQNYNSTDSEIFVVVASNLAGAATSCGVCLQWSEIY